MSIPSGETAEFFKRTPFGKESKGDTPSTSSHGAAALVLPSVGILVPIICVRERQMVVQVSNNFKIGVASRW